MTEIVTPRVVPNMPPAPLTSDPPQIFDDKCVAMAAGYPATIGGMNGSATDTNQNALAAKERAEQAQTAWSSVSAGVATINAALAAIQAGPVVSVMGRSGVVTGLVEAAPPSFDKSKRMEDAPVGQPAFFTSGTGAGADWPTTLEVSGWFVETHGVSGRKSQTAEQSLDVLGQQGWCFKRFLHDTTWSPWARVITDRTVIANRFGINANSATTSVYPSNGSRQLIVLSANTTLSVAVPRTTGDELVLMIYAIGNFSYAFGGASNVLLQSGASLPTVGYGQFRTLTLLPDVGGAGWVLYDGGRH